MADSLFLPAATIHVLSTTASNNRQCIDLLLVRHTELLVLVPASQTSVGLHCFNLQVHRVTVDGTQAQVGSSCNSRNGATRVSRLNSTQQQSDMQLGGTSCPALTETLPSTSARRLVPQQ
jgi:hypothetical protein